MVQQFQFWTYNRKNYKWGLRCICTPILMMTLAAIRETWNQVCIDEQMDDKNEVYLHRGILFCPKKEGDSETCCKIEEPHGHYGK